MNEDLTWTCHVCGRERPDALIAVAKFPIKGAGGLEATVNVRYCADNPACHEAAGDVDFLVAARKAFA